MEENNFNILCLDAGGSKGVYTLGVLSRLEEDLGKPLCEVFDLIYGTSTGSIIASFLGLGYSVKQISEVYFKLSPKILSSFSSRGRSRTLAKEAKSYFGDKVFKDFKTDVAIITTHLISSHPIVFRSKQSQTPGYPDWIEPAFGVKISDVVCASCATVPFFKPVKMKTEYHGELTLIDGGFSATNPTLFAIADCLSGYKISPHQIKIVNVGVGTFKLNAKTLSWKYKIPFIRDFLILIELASSSRSNTLLRIEELLFPEIDLLRISEYFRGDLAIHFLESNPEVLQKVYNLGRASYDLEKKNFQRIFQSSLAPKKSSNL